MKFKLQYSRTINTIYPADEKAMERLPHRIARELEEEYWCDCRITQNNIDFITTLPIEGFRQYNPLRFFINAALDGGAIWIKANEKAKIQIRYKVRFTWRFGVVLLLGILMSKSYWASDFKLSLFYILLPNALFAVTFITAIQVLKSIWEEALKNRYR